MLSNFILSYPAPGIAPCAHACDGKLLGLAVAPQSATASSSLAQVARRRSRRDVGSRGRALCLLSGTPESESPAGAKSRHLPSKQTTAPSKSTPKNRSGLRLLSHGFRSFPISNPSRTSTGRFPISSKPYSAAAPASSGAGPLKGLRSGAGPLRCQG